VPIELIRGLQNLTPQHQGCVATIGNFDGVHKGHQALLAKVKERAEQLQLPSLVMTFEPHPLEFFAPEKCAPRLTRWREKFTALADCGIDRVLVVRFNEAFAKLRAEEFAQQILVEKLGVKQVFVGDDFHFGYQREGNFDFLKNEGQRFGFGVESMSTLLLDGERVSSTLVRNALLKADHAKVKKLLGHPYAMMGRVVHGDRRGRILGFPTANIYLHRAVTPVRGVYAVRMHGIAPHSLPGVANVGIRPTVGGTRSLLEVHLFDFNQEIYGRHVSVEFCEKLREEKRFESLDLLKEQIWKDAEQAQKYFAALSS
jgi:riboflavin kinase/FMN adenylyltransferase